MKKNVFFLVAISINLLAIAGVNLKNGDFYISYTDHDFTNLKGIDITRTYNSKSTGSGLFGNGWGCNYETFIAILGDGTLVMHENGLGGKTYFTSSNIDDDLLSDCINQLTAAAIKNKDIKNNPIAIAAFKKQVRNSHETRADKWLKYQKLLLVKPPIHAINKKWQSYDRGFQTIVKLNDTEYQRTYANGEYELFNTFGKLIAKYDKYSKRLFYIQYNADNTIKTLIDAANNILEFSVNNNNLIEKITSSSGISTYTYDASNDLIQSIDASANTYQYSYDNNYNMTSIAYSDKSVLKIDYYHTNQRVKKITDRNGQVTDYVYQQFFDENGAIDNDHYGTYVIKANYTTADSNYYEYKIKTGLLGSRYTYKITTKINGIQTETIYDENSLPLSIERGQSKTVFKYNSKNGLIFKEDKATIIRITYNSAQTKIVRQETINKYDGDTTVYTYKYNEKEDLVYCTKNDNWVQLSYDSTNRIQTMTYNEGSLAFAYNTIGKPITITMAGKLNSSVIVTYNSNGTIEKVDSPDGHKTALAITSAFQQLLSIVKPSGTNLGM